VCLGVGRGQERSAVCGGGAGREVGPAVSLPGGRGAVLGEAERGKQLGMVS
jgi:hypothetical protein